MIKSISAMDLIANSWVLYKNNFDKFIQPIAILVLASIISLIPQFFDFPFDTLFFIITITIYISISVWLTVVMYQIADSIDSRKKFNQNEIYIDSFRRAGQYLWVYFLYVLIILGGIVLLVIPSIIFSVWYAFSVVAVAIEKKSTKVSELFSHSRSLVDGRWWSTLWNLILPQTFFTVIIFIVSFGIGGILTGGQYSAELLFNNFYFNILINIVSSIFAPLLLIPLLLLYKHLKLTSE